MPVFMIPRSKLNPERLLGAIRKAQTRKVEAERVADSFKKAGGAMRAVELINELLKSQKNPNPS